MTVISDDRLVEHHAKTFTFCVLIMTEKTSYRSTDHNDRDKRCLDVVTVMSDDRLTEHDIMPRLHFLCLNNNRKD